MLVETRRCDRALPTWFDRFCRSSTTLRSSLVASPPLFCRSLTTVSASLSASLAELLALLSLILRREEWKMDPTGLRGSGSTNEALNELLRLGMMIGSSSVEESSSDESQLRLAETSRELLLRGRPLRGPDPSPTMVVSALARPWASMVNRTEVCGRYWGDVSGIDARLDNRGIVLEGEILPDDRPLDLPAEMLGPLFTCGAGRAAGANVGSEPRPSALLPRFSL